MIWIQLHIHHLFLLCSDCDSRLISQGPESVNYIQEEEADEEAPGPEVSHF